MESASNALGEKEMKVFRAFSFAVALCSFCFIPKTADGSDSAIKNAVRQAEECLGRGLEYGARRGALRSINDFPFAGSLIDLAQWMSANQCATGELVGIKDQLLVTFSFYADSLEERAGVHVVFAYNLDGSLGSISLSESHEGRDAKGAETDPRRL